MSLLSTGALKWRVCLLLSIILFLSIDLAHAQSLTVIRAARMLDVATGKSMEPVYIVIEKGRIKSVNEAEPSDNAQTIDLGDMTLLPGLIDMHTHLAMDIDRESFIRPVKQGSADGALRGAHNARKTLRAGFTTVRNVGERDFQELVGVALMRAVESGLIEGPRIIPAGHPLSITGGHCDVTGFAPGVLERGPEAGIADGTDAILRAIRYQIKHGAKFIKVCATAGVLSFEEDIGAQQFSAEELQVAVQEACRHGLKVAAHAHGTEGIIAAIQAGVASIEHGSMLNDEAIQLMLEKGTYLVPTAYLLDAINLDALPPLIREKGKTVIPLAKESLRRAIQAGVKIAFGTDAALFPHGDNAKEFAVLVELGMTPLEAIQAATLNAADLLGKDDRGVISAGRLADIIAVPGDPLIDIRVLEDVQFVMQGGKVIKRP